MISVEAWTTIRYLKAQGMGTRAIAKQLGISRNTVRRALRNEQPPRYTRAPRTNPQLEPFEDAIREMLFKKRFIGIEKERPELTPLPAGRFVRSQEQFRKVSWDCLISFAGSRYSVPHQYAGKQVWVRTSQGERLEVYDQQGRLIARHQLSRQKGVTVLVRAHYKGLRREAPKTRVLLERAFLARFPDHGWFLEKLAAQQKMNPVSHLRPILEMADNYPKEAMCKAFSLALEYNTFSHRFINGAPPPWWDCPR